MVKFSVSTFCTLIIGVAVLLLRQDRVQSQSIRLTDSIINRFINTVNRFFYRLPPALATMSTPQMIEFNGYPVEEHKVVTKDNYILTLFRIPVKVNYSRDLNELEEEMKVGLKIPVILQHGDFCSSNDWLLLPSNDALPYVLAEDGFDVWLGNARGNNYSMGHQNLSPNELKFWDFGYDEIGAYDIPAVIEYVTGVTGHDQVNWIGHSAGTATFFVAMDQHPELNEKVEKMVALAPSFNIAESRFRFETLVPPPILNIFFQAITGGRLIPQRINQLLKQHAPSICYGDIPRQLCNNIIYLIGGYNPKQITSETASLITGHTPSDTSGKLILQMGQAVKRGRLHHYDYGSRVNLEKYGQSSPPGYNLSRVTVPIQAFYSLNDVRNSVPDAKKTINELGNVREVIEVSDPMWSHLDYTYGKDARVLVYNKILTFLNKSPK